mmetsp:Transcript_8777/g.13265  ORF Transcript_8777/g.13265 Transcript_8777/m.13265 type:complete len:98 (-) Transcript_8777:262-555(-)
MVSSSPLNESSQKATVSTTTMATENVYNQSATPIEMPMLIKDKLTEFELALADVSDEEKAGYLMAKEKGPDECNDDCVQRADTSCSDTACGFVSEAV